MFSWNPCFFDDPMDVGNLIFGASSFSKSSLNIWKFTVHILLKPGLENFDHYFASLWDECNCAVVWAFFGIGMKADLFQSCGYCWVFQTCWHIECSTVRPSPFRIWSRQESELMLVTDQLEPVFLTTAASFWFSFKKMMASRYWQHLCNPYLPGNCEHIPGALCREV